MAKHSGILRKVKFSYWFNLLKPKIYIMYRQL